MTAEPTTLVKVDDNTVIAATALPTGGQLCRVFNFAASEVTTIFSQTVEKKVAWDPFNKNTPDQSSPAVTSQMSVRKFSEFDDTREIEAIHKVLKEQLGGNPLPLSEKLTGKMAKASPSL